MKTIKIADREIGQGNKPFIIAEIAQAHDGSLGFAHSFIDAVADAGADAIKFQTHIASAESTKDETFRVPMSGQDKTRYDYWKRMEFSAEGWAGLSKHAHDAGLVFLSSAFSVEAVELLKKLEMPAWKIGSGEFKSFDLLKAMMETGFPVLYSSGMSTYAEVDEAVKTLERQNIPYGLFQCTSHYPVAMENVGLNVIQDFKHMYKCPVGLSDHSGTPFPALAAMAQGADMIEVHVTFDKGMYGPDTKSSLCFAELKHVCDSSSAFFKMQNNPVDKDAMAANMADVRNLFTKSIAFLKPQAEGTIIKEDMITMKKPGSGIPYTDKDKIIGKKLVRDVPEDRLLRWEDI